MDVGEAYERLMRAQIEGARRQVDVADEGEVGRQVPLWVSVNRYRPVEEGLKGDGGGEGLTLLWLHANGFHKGELGEGPDLRRMHANQASLWAEQRSGSLRWRTWWRARRRPVPARLGSTRCGHSTRSTRVTRAY